MNPTSDQRLTARLSALGGRDIRPDMEPCRAPGDEHQTDIDYSVFRERGYIWCECGTSTDEHQDLEDALADWNEHQCPTTQR